jgi:diguanylate cyclase (GGDEF)-like protein
MRDFEQALYEGILVAFGKTLAKYDGFLQGEIMRDVGRELIEYLNARGLNFEETGSIDDLKKLTDLFIENGFAESVEVRPAEKGSNYVWHKLYGICAYEELHKFAANPFLSCPLNLSLYYLADKLGKTMLLHSKKFDSARGVTESQYEVVDKAPLTEAEHDQLVIKHAHLFALAQEREHVAREEAQTDALTGLANRRKLQERGASAVHLARCRGEPLAVLMVDIDHFKRVNDTFGHGVGDSALRAVADLCRGAIRQTDIAARVGGEEFVIVLPNTPEAHAQEIAERLRAAVQDYSVLGPAADPMHLTVSIGIACLKPGSPDDFDALLDDADTALYAAKNHGRNRVSLAGRPNFTGATPNA